MATKKPTETEKKKLQIKDLGGKVVTDQELKRTKGGWRVICYSRSAAGRPW